MSKRRRLILVFGFLAMVAVMGFLALWRTAPKHGIKEETAMLIQQGMTVTEVEQILSAPAGRYVRRGSRIKSYRASVQITSMGDAGEWKRSPGSCRVWFTEDLGVMVWFDGNGKVFQANCGPLEIEFSLMDWFRRSVGFQRGTSP